MKTKIGINGFGRIGRLVFRTIKARCADTLEVVAVNDLFDAPTNAHLLKYDSTYGPYAGSVAAVDGHLDVDGKRVTVTAERDLEKIKWAGMGVDLVIECTGLFTDATKARGHVTSGGAKKVIISAPAKNEDITIVLGVNDGKYDPAKHQVVSNASCTTNGLAPVAKVLNDSFGIERGLLTTVHAYTNSQRLVDMGAKDLRDARAAGQNIVPSETGAARAVGLVIPELKGRFGGMAFRVPTPTVSVVDFTAVAHQGGLEGRHPGGDARVCARLHEGHPRRDRRAARVERPPRHLVLLRVQRRRHARLGNLVKVVAWYDNEWGYACRVADLAALMGSRL